MLDRKTYLERKIDLKKKVLIKLYKYFSFWRIFGSLATNVLPLCEGGDFHH
jgi:hypothetical protein